MGAPEVEGYLSDLAVERHVSAGTHNQAVIALVLLNSRGGGALVPRAPHMEVTVPGLSPARS